MGFTTPCFIRKNTQELRRGLKELGYFNNSPQWTNNCSIIWAYQYPMKGFDTPNYVIADSFDIPFDKHSALCGKFIDCGTNEELFLAIAALRDDTDKYQWFTDGDLWFKCGDEVCNEGRKIHKATVNELIEHFKIKEEQL
jgi:hypothetical protein|uniref:Uncharacterized protein n=1 Tax=Myoviridae sp. ct04y17 TaxID=2827652 RepID=A0A8S5SI40_9CAUD|nr:MAG TPA: hypothetical protein [Myoviridae sp. ct04y17]